MSAKEKNTTEHHGFQELEYIVYPAHGVGQIIAIEEQEVAGIKMELFVIYFERDKMHVKVPIRKALSTGMRKLSRDNLLERALTVLEGTARIKRTMWSKRAQEYDAKINSGDIIFIAEVLRDLFRTEDQPEKSYSERQIYEAALERMAREIAAIKNVGEEVAVSLIEERLCTCVSGHEETALPLAQDEGKSAKKVAAA